ncbi:MAG: hypothetical protein ACOYOA_11030 [Saprospiraceae bacterium]
MLLNIIISILISLGYIQSEADWYTLDQQQQDELIEIIIDDNIQGI